MVIPCNSVLYSNFHILIVIFRCCDVDPTKGTCYCFKITWLLWDFSFWHSDLFSKNRAFFSNFALPWQIIIIIRSNVNLVIFVNLLRISVFVDKCSFAPLLQILQKVSKNMEPWRIAKPEFHLQTELGMLNSFFS